MKALLLIVALVLPLQIAGVVPGNHAQVVFLNRLGTAIDAPVFLPDGRGAGFETGMVAQLFLVRGETLTALEPQTTFRGTEPPLAAAYVEPKDVVFPDVASGVAVTLRFRVWQSTYGTTWEEARDRGGYFGESEVTVVTGGGTRTPSNLIGLQGFVLQRAKVLQVAAISAEGLSIRLPAAESQTYTLEVSNDLEKWIPLAAIHGTGADTLTVPVAPGAQFFRAVLQ